MRLVTIGLLAGAVAFSGSLLAQRGPGGGGGGGPVPGGKMPSKEEIDKWRKAQSQGGQGGQGGAGQPAGQPGKDPVQEEMDKRIGWGENGDEERVLPGQTTPEKEKDEWLEKEADKLGLEEKKARSSFLKLAKKAWDDSEKEDKRWSDVLKKVKDDAEKKAAETKKHQDKLKEIWDKSDEELKKKETLDDTKLEQWKKDSEHLRKETATDKSARQDEIRARKVEEYRKEMEKWAKGGQGGNEGPKKERKEDEEGAPEGESDK